MTVEVWPSFFSMQFARERLVASLHPTVTYAQAVGLIRRCSRWLVGGTYSTTPTAFRSVPFQRRILPGSSLLEAVAFDVTKRSVLRRRKMRVIAIADRRRFASYAAARGCGSQPGASALWADSQSFFSVPRCRRSRSTGELVSRGMNVTMPKQLVKIRWCRRQVARRWPVNGVAGVVQVARQAQLTKACPAGRVPRWR